MSRRTPFGRLLTGSIIYGLGTVLVQLVNILLMPLLTAYLSPREYGAIAVLNIASLFLVAIFSLGIGVSLGICYFDSEERSYKDRLVWSAFLALVMAVSVLTAIGVPSISYWSGYLLESEEFRPAALFMLLAAGATIIALPFDTRLRLDERQTAFILASLISTITIGVLALFFVISLQRGATGFFEATLIGRVISALTFAYIGGRGTTLGINRAGMRRLVRLGIPVAPQYVFLYMLQYGNIEALKRFIGLDAAGIYSVGLTIGVAINVVISSISNAWVPFFLSYTNNREQASILFGRITTYYVLGVGTLSLLFFYCSKPLAIILSSPPFFEAHTVIGLTAVAFFVLGIYNLLLPPLYYAKEAAIATYMLLIAVVALIGSAYLLIPHFGLKGAAWAQIIAYGTLCLALHCWNRSQLPRYFEIKYEWSRLFLFFIFYLASVFVLLWIENLGVGMSIILYVIHSILTCTLVLSLMTDSERAAAWSLSTSFMRSFARI